MHRHGARDGVVGVGAQASKRAHRLVAQVGVDEVAVVRIAGLATAKYELMKVSASIVGSCSVSDEPLRMSEKNTETSFMA